MTSALTSDFPSVEQRDLLLELLPELRSAGLRPQWFGLGFIQMKLDATRRLHVWHPDLKGHIAEDEAHDHRYAFSSVIVTGCLEHEVYRVIMDPGGDHLMTDAACKPEKTRDPMPLGRCWLEIEGCYRLSAGSSYYFPSDKFHVTRAEAAATLLTRGPVLKDMARVIRPLGRTPLCPFAESRPEGELWSLITEVLETAP